MDLRKFLGSVHLGDYVEIEYEQRDLTGFSRHQLRRVVGYIIRMDDQEVYLSRKDPLLREERRVKAMILYENILSWEVLKRVDEERKEG